MPVFDEALEFLTSKDQSERIKFARALRDSYLLTEEDPETPYHPEAVAEAHQLPLASLVATRIVLDRPAVYQYCVDLTLGIKESTMGKRLTATKYKDHFNREIACLDNRHVFTYSEVRSFFRYNADLGLPSALEQILT